MLSPATLAALHRLIAILRVLIDALATPVDGKPRPLAARLAARAFSAYLERLATDLEGMDQTPEPPQRPSRNRSPRVRAPSAPRIIDPLSPTQPEPDPVHAKSGTLPQAPHHAQNVPVS